MPIYAYRCMSTQCGKEFESLSKPYEEVHCPECGTVPAERVITAHGGYSIKGDNSASRRPNQAGSFRGKK